MKNDKDLRTKENSRMCELKGAGKFVDNGSPNGQYSYLRTEYYSV